MYMAHCAAVIFAIAQLSCSGKVYDKVWSGLCSGIPEPNMSETWSETRDANTVSGRVWSGPVWFIRVRLVEFGH